MERLEEGYYNLQNAASFSNPKLLRDWVLEKGYDISLNEIEEWLKAQDTYTLHKQSYIQQDRPKIVPIGRDYLWDSDLLHITNISDENDGVCYLLVCVDLFSRYAWVRGLKGRKQRDVIDAMSDIFSGGRKCERMRTDLGSEYGAAFIQFLLDNNVRHHKALNEKKANYAERFIRTLKRTYI